MIRINLLGTTKAKSKRFSVSLPIETGFGEGPSLFWIGLIIAMLTVVGNGYWYWKLTSDAVKIREETARVQTEYAHLNQVKLTYQELERQKDAYKKRVDVITGLQSKQAGPAMLLSTVGDTVNRTDRVWLSNMSDDGKNINLKGVALSVHSVANLMTNLKNTGYFKNIEIKSSVQDEKVTQAQAFVFELSCEKQPAQVTGQPKS